MIRLYNNQKQKIAEIEAIEATVKRVINGEFSFSFSAPEAELKSEYFLPGNLLLAEGQFFEIRRVEQEHNSRGILYVMACEHVNYRLLDWKHQTYTKVGTPAEILADILDGTGFQAGIVDFTQPITITSGKEITKKDLIYQLANLLGGEIEYTNQGYTINILNEIGKNQGFQARIGKNLLGIKKTMDNRNGLLTVYEIDLLELKNCQEYREKELGDLEKIEIGDTIRIIDEMLNLDIENRVVSIERNPVAGSVIKVEIANQIELITDKINQIATESIKQGKLYNNVSISENYGFRAERSDKRARTTMAANTMAMEVGDGTGNYTKAMYFDVLTGKYKFIGDIHASGNIIGGTINIGNGTFKVDAGGHVTANSIKIGGGSGIRNLADAGELATKNRINGTYIDNDSISTPHLKTNAVTADKISVSNLSAISANIGKITAGEINGINIYGSRFYNSWKNAYIEVSPYGSSFPEFSLVGPSAKTIFWVGQESNSDDILITIDRTPRIEFTDHYNRLTGGRWAYGQAEIATIHDIPDVDVHAGGGQTIYFQVYDGHLEYKLSGGSYTALANA